MLQAVVLSPEGAVLDMGREIRLFNRTQRPPTWVDKERRWVRPKPRRVQDERRRRKQLALDLGAPPRGPEQGPEHGPGQWRAAG